MNGENELRGRWLAVARQTHFSAPKLASTLGVSLRQLERSFREATGWPPQEWLRHARLCHACNLLIEGLLPKEIFQDLGFASMSGFFHAFKSYHGCTTLEFLRNHRKVKSPGLRQFKSNERLARLRHHLAGLPDHVAILEALDEALALSERMQLYYIRSARRLQAADVAAGQHMAGTGT